MIKTKPYLLPNAKSILSSFCVLFWKTISVQSNRSLQGATEKAKIGTMIQIFEEIKSVYVNSVIYEGKQKKSFVCKDAQSPLQNDCRINSVLHKTQKGHCINWGWRKPIQHLCGKQNAETKQHTTTWHVMMSSRAMLIPRWMTISTHGVNRNMEVISWKCYNGLWKNNKII